MPLQKNSEVSADGTVTAFYTPLISAAGKSGEKNKTQRNWKKPGGCWGVQSPAANLRALYHLLLWWAIPFCMTWLLALRYISSPSSRTTRDFNGNEIGVPNPLNTGVLCTGGFFLTNVEIKTYVFKKGIAASKEWCYYSVCVIKKINYVHALSP